MRCGANLAIYMPIFTSRRLYDSGLYSKWRTYFAREKGEFCYAGLVHGLNIEYYPFSKEEMTRDVDGTKKRSGNGT